MPNFDGELFLRRNLYKCKVRCTALPGNETFGIAFSNFRNVPFNIVKFKKKGVVYDRYDPNHYFLSPKMKSRKGGTYLDCLCPSSVRIRRDEARHMHTVLDVNWLRFGPAPPSCSHDPARGVTVVAAIRSHASACHSDSGASHPPAMTTRVQRSEY
jgi:hypothetical protein